MASFHSLISYIFTSLMDYLFITTACNDSFLLNSLEIFSIFIPSRPLFFSNDNLIKKQKLSYFGHIKRHNTLEKLFLEGTCEGRRGRGRPRRRWTQDIGKWMGISTVEAGRQALERGEFRQVVWEATSIKDPP